MGQSLGLKNTQITGSCNTNPPQRETDRSLKSHVIAARTHLQLKKVGNGHFHESTVDGQGKKPQELQTDHQHLDGGQRDPHDAGEDLKQQSAAITEFLD